MRKLLGLNLGLLGLLTVYPIHQTKVLTSLHMSAKKQHSLITQ